MLLNILVDRLAKLEFAQELYKDQEEDKSKIIGEIDTDSFVQESFSSKKESFSSKKNKIVVDLKKDKILIPATNNQGTEEESLIHPKFLGDEQQKIDKWIKKLYAYRNQ